MAHAPTGSEWYLSLVKSYTTSTLASNNRFEWGPFWFDKKKKKLSRYQIGATSLINWPREPWPSWFVCDLEWALLPRPGRQACSHWFPPPELPVQKGVVIHTKSSHRPKGHDPPVIEILPHALDQDPIVEACYQRHQISCSLATHGVLLRTRWNTWTKGHIIGLHWWVDSSAFRSLCLCLWSTQLMIILQEFFKLSTYRFQLRNLDCIIW